MSAVSYLAYVRFDLILDPHLPSPSPPTLPPFPTFLSPKTPPLPPPPTLSHRNSTEVCLCCHTPIKRRTMKCLFVIYRKTPAEMMKARFCSSFFFFIFKASYSTPKTECGCPYGGVIENGRARNPLILCGVPALVHTCTSVGAHTG